MVAGDVRAFPHSFYLYEIKLAELGELGILDEVGLR